MFPFITIFIHLFAVNTAHSGVVNGLCYTHDGFNLISFGTDNRLRLWSTLSGENTNVNFGKIQNESLKCMHLTVSYNTSPTLIYVPHDSNIDVFNMTNGDKLDTLRGHYNQVACCFYDSMRQDLYSGGNDRNILVWKPNTAATVAYEESINASKPPPTDKTKSNFVRRVGAMADTWSSDED